MKKLLAIILCAVMLLSAAAFAEGTELTINNVVISGSDGTVIDLSGIDLKLAIDKLENQLGLRLTLGGNGEEIASGMASLDESQLLLAATGLSSVYGLDVAELTAALQGMMITEQDVQDFIAVWEAWSAAMDAAITDLGIEEIEGVAYQNYSINVPAEATDALYTGIIAILDRHPMIVSQLLADTGYNTLAELYAAMEVAITMEGSVSISETDMTMNLVATGVGADNAQVQVGGDMYMATIVDEATGTTAMDITFMLSEINGDTAKEILTIGCTLAAVNESGEFYGMDGYVIVPEGGEGEYNGVLFGVYSPIMQGADLWQVSLLSYDQTVSMDLAFGETEGADCAYASIVADDVMMNFYYEILNGVGEAGASFQEGDMVYEAVADIAIGVPEGGWLPMDGANAVDILSLSEEQIQQLYTEGYPLLMNIISGLASANETVAALVGSMMG